jgi:prophage maintenance system killer protein
VERAVYWPRRGYQAVLAETATAPFESRFMNHLFVDGDACVALFATYPFLRLNNCHGKSVALQTGNVLTKKP